MKFVKRRAWFFLSLILILSGCGSDNSDFVASGTGGPQLNNNYFLGRVILEGPVEGAQVQLTNTDGSVLQTLTTDSFGNFWGYYDLPQDFSIRVTRPGDSMIYRREVRGGYDRLTMYVHPLSTLASVMMERHGLSQSEAESRLRSFFFMPQNFPFDFVENHRGSPFSPAAFQALAQNSGDISTYYEQLATQIGGGTNAQLLVLAESPSSNAITDVAKTVVGDVFGDTVSLADAGVFGAVTQSLGLYPGTSGALAAISNQLDMVLSEISALQADFDSASASSSYQTAIGNVDASLDDLTNRVSDIVGVVDNTPMNIGVNSLVSEISGLAVDDDVSVILDHVLGRNSNSVLAILYAQDRSLNGGYGLSSSDTNSYLGVPLRQVGLTDQLVSQQGWLLGHLTAATVLYAETAHLQIPVADALIDAGASIDDLTAAKQQAIAQVPTSLPEWDLIDAAAGLHWCVYFQNQMGYDDAVNFAASYQRAGYTGWRLATRDEITNLTQNRVGKLVSDQDSDSEWRSGWSAMGANLSEYGVQTYKNSSIFVSGNTDKQGQSFYQYEYDSLNGGQNVYQWQGVNSNPATSLYTSEYLVNYEGAPDTTLGSETTFIIVRTASDLSKSGDPFTYCRLGNSTLDVSHNGNQLTARASLAAGGSNYSFDVTQRTYWKSSNNSMASVSNYAGSDLETGAITNIPANPSGTYAGPGPLGSITWHPSLDGTPLQPVTFTGTFWAPSGTSNSVSSATGSIQISPPTNLGAPVPTSAQVLPANSTLNVAAYDSTNGQDFNYYVTTFYRDGQLFAPDLSSAGGNPSQATFSLRNSNNVVIDTPSEGGGFLNTAPGILTLYPHLPAGDYTVSVTYQTPVGGTTQSITGTTPLHIDNSGPSISTINPGQGPTSGGQLVTLTGERMNTVTSVTVDGVSVSFTANTPTELTFTTPSHAAGTVTVIVQSQTATVNPVSDTASYLYQ